MVTGTSNQHAEKSCASQFFFSPSNHGPISPTMVKVVAFFWTWVDEFIPYYMEILGVDRPDRTSHPPSCNVSKQISTVSLFV